MGVTNKSGMSRRQIQDRYRNYGQIPGKMHHREEKPHLTLTYIKTFPHPFRIRHLIIQEVSIWTILADILSGTRGNMIAANSENPQTNCATIDYACCHDYGYR